MKNTPVQKTNSPAIVLGRERFEKFSAVEGIFLTEQEKQFLTEMDRLQLGNQDRRSIILAKFKDVA